MNRQRGFTLIELLVVIAIIGILASIVLTYLSDARDKGRNIKIRAQLTGARSSAEAYYGANGKYNGTGGNVSGNCGATGSMFTSTVGKMAEYTDLASYPYGTDITCYSENNAYAISATLATPEGGSTHWCVDSSGKSKGRSTSINSPAC